MPKATTCRIRSRPSRPPGPTGIRAAPIASRNAGRGPVSKHWPAWPRAAAPAPLRPNQVDPASGVVYWPVALEDNAFQPARSVVEKLTAKWAQYGTLNATDQAQLHNLLRDVRAVEVARRFDAPAGLRSVARVPSEPALRDHAHAGVARIPLISSHRSRSTGVRRRPTSGSLPNPWCTGRRGCRPPGESRPQRTFRRRWQRTRSTRGPRGSPAS